MSKLTLSNAFRHYGAKLINPRWSCSEIAHDGSLVLSGWNHHLDASAMRYEDRLSRWSYNRLGRERLRKHLSQAAAQNLPVRLVIATADDPKAVETERDASTLRKTFAVRDDVIGRVIAFDGDEFVIEFS